jgi:hypothetical protein
MSGSFRAAEGARSTSIPGGRTGTTTYEHVEYAAFEAEAICDSSLHRRRQGFRIYPGMVREAD